MKIHRPFAMPFETVTRMSRWIFCGDYGETPTKSGGNRRQPRRCEIVHLQHKCRTESYSCLPSHVPRTRGFLWRPMSPATDAKIAVAMARMWAARRAKKK